MLLEHGVTVGFGVSVADKVLNTRFDAAWVRPILLTSPRVLADRVPVFLGRRHWRPTGRSPRRQSHSCPPTLRNCSESAWARDTETSWLHGVVIYLGTARWWVWSLRAGGSWICCRLLGTPMMLGRVYYPWLGPFATDEVQKPPYAVVCKTLRQANDRSTSCRISGYRIATATGGVRPSSTIRVAGVRMVFHNGYSRDASAR